MTVGGRTVAQLDVLSRKAQTLIALVDGAERWLAWAAGTGSPAFHFSDEVAFVTGVQAGLHGTELLLLTRLATLVHPRKLWTLSEAQLNQVLAYEGDDADNPVLAASLREALTAAGVHGASELALGRKWLADIGRSDDPVFQALSLADQVALLDLVTHPPSNAAALDRPTQQTAAAFAVESAQTPNEFCANYALYFGLTGDTGASGLSAARRSRAQLVGAAQPFLRAPITVGVPSAVDLYALVNRWVDEGHVIGFVNVGVALRELVAAGLTPGSTATETAARAKSLMDGVQQFLKQTEPARVTVSQDGLTHSYWLESKRATARLDRTPDGGITVGAYRAADTHTADEQGRAHDGHEEAADGERSR